MADLQSMCRIPPLVDQELPAASREILAEHAAAGGHATNMKRTLARSPLALRVLLEWYPLRDAVADFLGDRAALLFAHAISTETDCLICSTFFRRLLANSGEDPDRLQLDAWETTIVAFGRQLTQDANGVSDELFAQLSARLSADQIVELTAFGGLMIATNVFNNALAVDLDEYLGAYRKPSA